MPGNHSDEPNRTIRGPRTGGLPPGVGAQPGELPYTRERRTTLAWLAVGIAAVTVITVITVLVLTKDDGTTARRAAGAPTTTTDPPATSTSPSTTTDPPVPASTAAPTPAPAPPGPGLIPPAPVPPGPVPAPVSLPEHHAVYRDGKLYLEGAVPNKGFSDAFFAKAAAVIGPQNVINNYIIDPRAPTPTEGRVIVGEQFLFPFGSAAIDPSYSNILELGVIVMRQNPQVILVIIGHTDDVGDAALNQRLSEDRANAVVDYLVARGIDRSRFRASGRGETEPEFPNDTPENQAKNRRIEAQLINLLQ